jgi:dUTP pyrophosphatase
MTVTTWQERKGTLSDYGMTDTITNTIQVKYFKPDTKRIEKIEKGDWIDLSAAEDTELFPGEYLLIPLGVAIKLPEGYEAHIAPRSSTFKNWGFLQTNGVGVVDESYCGDTDQWLMPVYPTRRASIKKGDRICQFRIMAKMPILNIVEVDKLTDPDRGGHGSSGVK